jgi:hypothetical protein
MKKKMIAVAALGLVMTVGGPTTVAFAGEITGNGKPTPIRTTANSECAFSGQSDGDDPTNTQSWGRIPKADRDFLTSIGVSPGVACNGHLTPAKGDATPEP